VFSLSSIELGARFVGFAAAELARLRSPLRVEDSERLGRELFSGHLKGKRLKVNAFLINEKSESGLSLDRLSLAPRRLFSAVGRAAAARRSVKFKGFATLDCAKLRSVEMDDGIRLDAVGDPTLENAFHADVALLPDKGDDYYLLVATELNSISQPDLE